MDKLRDLIISYAGLNLQEPEMFPQPAGWVFRLNLVTYSYSILLNDRRPLGPPELVAPLLSLSALTGPLLSSTATSTNTLGPTEVEPFLQDLVKRFEPDNEIDSVLGPVVVKLCSHESLTVGFASGDGWRGVISGLEALVSVKPIAVMITRLPEWNPDVSAPQFEMQSLMGQLLRLGVFHAEWVSAANFVDFI